MNLYRFFKTRVFYITLLITVITFGLLSRLETDPSSEIYEAHVEQQSQNEEHVGIVANEEITAERPYHRTQHGQIPTEIEGSQQDIET